MTARLPPGEQVLVMGAGAVGCYLGGRLALAGVDVHLVGRPRVLGSLRGHGLAVEEPGGRPPRPVPSHRLHLYETPPADIGATLVLLCVKTAAVASAAAALDAAQRRVAASL